MGHPGLSKEQKTRKMPYLSQFVYSGAWLPEEGATTTFGCRVKGLPIKTPEFKKSADTG